MKKRLSTFLIYLLSFQASSGSLDNWVSSHIEHTPWLKEVEHCNEWTPSASETLVNKVIRQKSSCEIHSHRYKKTYEKNKLTNELRLNDSQRESQFNREVKWRTAPGEKDIIVSKGGVVRWGEWSPLGKHEDCTTSLDYSEHLNINQLAITITQCKQTEERKKNTFDVYLSGKEVLSEDPTLKEYRVREIYFTLSQQGKKDVALPEKVESSPWETISLKCNKAEESASVSKETPRNIIFLNSRECKGIMVRNERTVKPYLSGKREVSEPRLQEKAFEFTEWYFRSGEKDFRISEGWELLPGYKIVNDNEACSRTFISEEHVPMGVPFIQYRQCSGNLIGREIKVAYYASGDRETEEERDVIRNVSFNTIETTIGKLDEFIEEVGEIITLPLRHTSDERCGVYSPSTQNIPRGVRFTQHVQCYQDGVQDRVQTQRWHSGLKEVKLPSIRKQREFLLTRDNVGEASMLFRSEQFDLSYSKKLATFRFDQMWKPKNISVSYEASNLEQEINIVITSPNGERLYLPTIRQRSGNFYFSLNEHQASSLGEWSIEATSIANSDAHVSVRIDFVDN